MCNDPSKYMSLVREYSKEIIMFMGFGIAFLVYSDFKAFMEKQTEVLQQIESRLTALETEAKVMLDHTVQKEKE